MDKIRKSGVLLHPTSLPGPYGIGEIGPEARYWVDQLVDMKQKTWQILPIGPTGFADSPYQSFSSFAGNELIISFSDLLDEGLLTTAELVDFPQFSQMEVDFGQVIPARRNVLTRVCDAFQQRASIASKKAYENFCKKNAFWLDNYAFFRAKKDISETHTKILQFLFDCQWTRLRDYCYEKGIELIGDVPIFVAHDSADVWAYPELFHLDNEGNPTVVAGVPPDYFSATGQLWGNPLFCWEAHKESDYAWWIARMQRMLDLVDIVRIDHFRGFDAYWEIPASEETAINGKWVPGPSYEFFDALFSALGELPVIAEDLGLINQEVEALRDHYQFPGMRIMQFLFGRGWQNDSYHPHAFPENCVSYTGTHDNHTIQGWFNDTPGENNPRPANEIESERQAVLDYTKTDGSQINWDLIWLSMKSNAFLSVIPLQDILGLGAEGRMNIPGTSEGNWKWRFKWEQLDEKFKQRVLEMTHAANRCL